MEIFGRMTETLWREMDEWLHAAVRMLPNIVVAAIVLFGFMFVAKIARRFLTHFLERVSQNRGVNGILATTVYYVLVAAGVFAALGILHLEKTVTSLLAGAGIAGIALGFAFQDIASNFISGILIAFTRPFSVGDIVRVDAFEGTITRVDIRTTSLETADGLQIIIPNKDMFTKTIVNYTTTPIRRAEVKVGVSYGEDLTKVKNLALACLDTIPYRDESKPIEVSFSDFGDSSINLKVGIWIHYPGDGNLRKTIDEAIVRIKVAFDKEGIVIPFPVRTLDFAIKGGESLRDQLQNYEGPPA